MVLVSVKELGSFLVNILVLSGFAIFFIRKFIFINKNWILIFCDFLSYSTSVYSCLERQFLHSYHHSFYACGCEWVSTGNVCGFGFVCFCSFMHIAVDNFLVDVLSICLSIFSSNHYSLVCYEVIAQLNLKISVV